jgi:hypothetical protein
MADHALTYFGKPLADLQYVDIEHFFASEHSESDQIEFKSVNPNGPLEAKLPGIIEGITAFLNSSGGLLIWGAPEGVKVEGRKEKVFVGSPTNLPLTVEKDWLISKIADKIIPLPRGFRVQLVACATGQVAVFEVDESPYSPHQADNRYYMRLDGQSKPAPHHYIEALFKKVTFPRLEVYLKEGSVKAAFPHPAIASHTVEVAFLFFNFSPFLNEEKLFFQIEIRGGRFGGVSTPSGAIMPAPTYINDRRVCRSDLATDISLSYGYPFVLNQQLVFHEQEIKHTNGRATIDIIFSGRAAPAKFCRYQLKFSPDRKQVVFNISEQNQLLSDINQRAGKTNEELLDNIGVLKPKASDNTWFLEDE